MPKIYYRSVPYVKEDITLALESGIDGLIVEEQYIEKTKQLAIIEVIADKNFPLVKMQKKKDEEEICKRLLDNENLIIADGWEIIPVENLLAQSANVSLEVQNISQAKLAFGILECGVKNIVVSAEGLHEIKTIIEECKQNQGEEPLEEAEIIEVTTVGLGHRVCVDTLSLFKRGQGMLVGNSSAFTFLVHAETESNEYVAARPFRVNAGGVHAYVRLANNKTCYLEELRSGDEVLAVHADKSTSLVTVGRIKVEVRPMLKIVAKIGDVVGSVFLQNAETIRLTQKDSNPISVVDIKIGDKILCRRDIAGRHFGMAISEDIQEL